MKLQKIILLILMFSIFMLYDTSSHGLSKTDITNNDLPLAIIAFSENILLSTNDSRYSNHVEPTLAISDNGTIFAGWKNAHTHIGGGIHNSFTKSVDNGKSWDNPQEMPWFEPVPSFQSDPWMVWFDGTLYYAYLESGGEQFSQITVARSNDYCQSWELTCATDADGFADKETMTVSPNGYIYVAYDDIGGLSPVRLTRSIDGGVTFQEISVISTEGMGPYLTTNNFDQLFVAYTILGTEGDVFVDYSLDFGESFYPGGPIDINSDDNAAMFTTSGGRPARITLPVIQFDQNNRMYVIWSDIHELASTFDIYLRYSDDYGETWSERIQINPKTEGHQWQPDFDIDSQGRLHIVYYDQRGGCFRSYYRMATYTGALRNNLTLTEPLAIASQNTSEFFTRPGDYFTVRVDSQDIPHIVWTDGRDGSLDIYYSHGIPEIIENTTTSQFTTNSTSNVNTKITTPSPSAITGLSIEIVILGMLAVIPLRRMIKKKK